MTAPTILTWQKVSAMLKGYPGMKTHGFLVLEIPLVFDPATESVQLTGINLQYAGERELFLEQYGHAALARNRPILSQEETAAHLNNGTFTRAFNTLQEKGAWGRMILLTAYCMKVGGNITSDQIGFLKSVYTKVDMPVGVQEQFAEALEEYTSGEPYRPLEKKWAKDRKHIHESDTYNPPVKLTAEELARMTPEQRHDFEWVQQDRMHKRILMDMFKISPGEGVSQRRAAASSTLMRMMFAQMDAMEDK